MVNISKIEKDKNNLNIKWSDGEISSFNYLWLRDNCPSAHDKDSNHLISPSSVFKISS